MKKNFNKLLGQKGSMMVEALAMLGLITMVTPVLYKKAAERTTELQDINTASQIRTLSKALDDYIKDNYVDFSTSGSDLTRVDPDDLIPYLPYGFNVDSSKYFEAYEFSVLRDIVEAGTPREHVSLTGMVLAPAQVINNESKIPGIRSSKIASMIGANGGVYKTCDDLTGNAGKNLCGVQGGWVAKPSDYGFTDVPDGSIASSSIHAITATSTANMEHVLFRDDSMHNVDYNTMKVTLYMGANDISDVHNLIADAADNEIRIKGEAGAEANLVVEGNASIENLLEAGSANIANDLFKVDSTATNKIEANDRVTITSGGLGVTGDTKIDGKTEIIGGTAADGTATVTISGKTDISGETTIKDGKLIVKKGEEVSEGLEVKGGTVESSDGNDYSLVVRKVGANDGSVLIENNLRINNDLYVGGKFEADKIFARTELGGGLMADGNYNFDATADSVQIRGNHFSVGDRLETDDASAVLKSPNYELNLTTTEGTLRSIDDNEKIALTPGVVDIQSSGEIFANSANGQLRLNTDGAVLRNNSTTDTNSLEINNTQLLMKNTVAGTESKIVMENNEIGMDSKNVVLDSKKIIFAENADAMGGFGTADGSGSSSFDNEVTNKGVIIRREGMINLPVADSTISTRKGLDKDSGEQDKAGYIKLDRILANQEYKQPWKNNASYHPTGTDNMGYDAYQVNPAYTSVMHDIKLTSRGGARLSDVLPDFINKGIYVIDNTYKEEQGKTKWEDYTVKISDGKPTVTGGPVECNSTAGDCASTPWLGFVPSPQCPPGYSKVITINPIRWKMADTFAVAAADVDEDLYEKGSAEWFKSFFIAERNPVDARFELEGSIASETEEHTHYVKSGTPLTYQINTWLNTTIGGVRAGSTMAGTGKDEVRNGAFLGWHAIMGFLYHGSDYKDYVNYIGGRGSDVDGKIVWNLFPVYNEEMTAISTVYCYFERRVYDDWSWQEDLVDTGYDQLFNFRGEYSDRDKTGANTTRNGPNGPIYNGDTSYRDRLNDPALKYRDPW